MSKTTRAANIRDVILSVNTVKKLDDHTIEEFLPAGYYVDRLETAINAYIAEVIGEDVPKLNIPQNEKQRQALNNLRAEQRKRAGL